MDELLRLKNEIIAACRQAYAEKLVTGTSGNLSIFLKDRGEMLITPTSLGYDIMKPEDIVHMQLDGTLIDSVRQPSSEWRMHAGVYGKIPGIGCLLHTHSPYATAFATLRKGIPVILIEMTPFLGGDIPCTPFAKPGTWELAEAAAHAFSTGRNSCLLGSHGVLVEGCDTAQAIIRAQYAEEAAMIYHHALMIGTPVTL